MAQMQWSVGDADADVVVDGLNCLAVRTVDAVWLNNAITAALWTNGAKQVPTYLWDSAAELLEKWAPHCNHADTHAVHVAIHVIRAYKARELGYARRALGTRLGRLLAVKSERRLGMQLTSSARALA